MRWAALAMASGSILAMAPALVTVLLLLWKLPAPEPHPHDHSRHIDWTKLRAKWKPLSLHYSLVFLRSMVQLGFGQVLTLYLVRERSLTGHSAVLVELKSGRSDKLIVSLPQDVAEPRITARTQ